MTATPTLTTANIRQSSCSGEVRLTKEGKLQQLWVVKAYAGGQQIGASREWRDVPTVDEAVPD